MTEIDLYRYALWAVFAVSGTFGTALVGLIVWNAKRAIAKQEEIAKDLSEKQEAIENRLSEKIEKIDKYLQSELRAMDVRLSVVETLVLPRRPAGPIVQLPAQP